LAGDFDAALEQNQAGNGADAHLPGQIGVGFTIELAQAAAALQLCGSLLEDRRKGLAGAAPTGPDIHQQRQVALQLAGKVGLRQGEWRGGQYFALAAAAARRVAQTLGRNAVEPVAMRAGDQQRIANGSAPAAMTPIWSRHHGFSSDQPRDASSAWLRSARMSSICSMPMDRRTMSRGTPAFCSSSSLSWRWVVDAGWQASDLASPILTRRTTSCSASMKRAPASCPP